ncbi:MAG: hypothetical protein AAF696_24275 [Bacteroidota bacterium]
MNKLIKEMNSAPFWIGVMIFFLANIGLLLIGLLLGKEIINFIFDVDRPSSGKKFVLGGYYINLFLWLSLIH